MTLLLALILAFDTPPEIWPDEIMLEPVDHYWRCWPAWPVVEMPEIWA